MSHSNSSLQMETYENKVFDEEKKKIEARGLTVSGGRWTASINGPWYDDSNPEGFGDSEEEAKQNALKELIKIRDSINTFLEKETE